MTKKTKLVKEGLFGDIAQTVSRTARAATDKVTSGKMNLAARAAAFLNPNKSMYGFTERDRLAARKFIDKFVERGIATLSIAINNNLVNPNSNAYQLTPKVQKATAATLGLGSKTAKTSPFVPAPQQSQTFTFGREKYTKGPKGWVDSKGNIADPNVAKLLDRAASQANSTQQTPTNTSQTRPNAPSAKAPAQTPAPSIIIPSTYRKKTTSETTYTKLNQIFENYMSQLEKLESLEEQKPTSLPSVSQYFYDNFLKSYLRGIPIQPMEPKIHQILKNLPNLYKTGQLKKELEELALVAFTLAPRSNR